MVTRSEFVAGAKLLGASFSRAFVLGAAALGTLLGSPAVSLAQPLDQSSCIASAQNRSTPLGKQGGYVLSNLPGEGLVPFAVASPRPFRIRVTCNDGSVGETALAFPVFGESVVESGEIVWGKKTEVPSQLRLELSKSVISASAPTLTGIVTARYAGGTEKVVTARSTGTGYRSSSNGYVGVTDDGQVFLQPIFAGTGAPPPSFVTITAENDGVISSRLVKLVGSRGIAGSVTQQDGRDVRNLEVRLSIPGNDDLLTTTESSGGFQFDESPVVINRDAVLTVLDRLNRRVAGAIVHFDGAGNTAPASIALKGPGTVQVDVVDAGGRPQSGVPVAVSDAYSRAVGLVPATQLSDANGQVAFANVPSGEIGVISTLPGFAAVPGRYSLTAGSAARITLYATGGGGVSSASIVGQVVQLPNRTPAVGAIVELIANNPGAPILRQMIDGSGRFTFAGLPAGTAYAYRALVGGELVRTGVTSTGSGGGEQQLPIELPATRGLNGLVIALDGQSPAPGVSIQINSFNSAIGTWISAGSTVSRANGSFTWRYLDPRVYQLQALAPDGSSALTTIDLSGVPLGSMQDVRLQLSSTPVQARLSVRATVFGSTDFGPLGAELFVRNSTCPSWCSQGGLATTRDTLVTGELGQGGNDFELRWRGRTRSFSVDITPELDGQTVQRVVDFGPDVIGVNQIPSQRSLFSFDVAQGMGIYARVMGFAPSGGVPAAAALKFELYAPDGQLLAQGTGFDLARPAGGFVQPVNYGSAPVSGRYTLVVSPLNDAPGNLGGYGLLVDVADRMVVPKSWPAAGPAQFGGTVAGKVYKYNGDPASGALVLVKAGVPGKLQLVEQVVAGQDGAYAHLNLPLGPVTLSAADAGGVVLARAQGALPTDGDHVERDLRFAARTRVALTLQVSQGSISQAGGNASVTIADAFNNRQEQIAVPAGLLVGDTTLVVAGDQATLKIAHPNNAMLVAERTVTGIDGDTVTLTVAIPTGSVSGKVLYGTMEAATQISVTALDSGGIVIGQVNSVGDGSFSFPVLPASTSLLLKARDAALDVSVTANATPIEAVEILSSDLVLPTASVGGTVKKSDGTLLVGAQVQASFTGGANLNTTTDATGRYSFARVPAGRVVKLVATDASLRKSPVLDVQASVGQQITSANLAMSPEGATVQGRVVNSTGQPLANIEVSISAYGNPVRCNDLGNPIAAVLTDSMGRYTFSNVPLVKAMVAAKRVYSPTCVFKTSVFDVAVPNQTYAIADFVFDDPGSVRLRIVDPGGNPVPTPSGWGATVFLLGAGLHQDVPTPTAGERLVENVLPGSYSATWNSAIWASVPNTAIKGTATVTSGNTSNLNLVVPMLRGRVTYSDGTPVTSATVWIEQSDGWPWPNSIMATVGGAETVGGAPVANSYVLAPIMLGDYALVVHDNATGIERRWTGNFASLPTQPMSLVMPSTTRLEVCAQRPDGTAFSVAGGTLVTTMPWGSTYWGGIQLWSAPNGPSCFVFAKVPVSDAVLNVTADGGMSEAWSLKIPESAANGTHRINVKFQERSNLKCLTPVTESTPPGGSVRTYLVPNRLEQAMWMSTSYGNYLSLTQGAGNCLQQQYAAPGRYRAEQVIQNNSYAPARSHVLDLDLIAGQETNAQLPAANTQPVTSSEAVLDVPVGATRFSFDEYMYEGGYGQLYAIEERASGGYPFYFFDDMNAPTLLLNGWILPPRRLLLSNRLPGTREIVMGPYEQGDRINLTRRLYVPIEGGYARLVETVTNNSTQTQTVKLALVAPAHSHCSASRITGLRDAVTAGYAGYEDCEGAMVHVFAGIGAAANQGATTELEMDENRGLRTQWSMTLTPGQSASIMHFVVVTPMASKTLTAITPRANALVRLTDPRMVEGLSANDRSLIKNFTVGQ